MSVGAVIAVAGGGCVLLFGAIAVMMVWLRRSHSAREAASLGRLQEEMAGRGWTFEERNDSYVSVFHAQTEYTLRNPLHPLTPPPKAVAARDVITGSHRGRPFLAASFDVRHQGQHFQTGSIWVRLPAPRPALTVRRAARAESKISAGIGLADLQLGNPDFDEQFEVSTENERFAIDVLNPRMIQFLLTDPRQFRGFQLLGDQLDVVDPVNDHRDPAELIPALDLRCDILDLIPPAVWA